MPLILPNSAFYHIGRTGGHWVSHVLWQSRLVQKRLYPLHLTPSQAAVDPEFEDRAFRVCFVRHPLHWLASLWRHEMEFGWDPNSLITKLAYSEYFDTFLEKMLSAWPEGPCSSQMQPYLETCTFVGKVETLKEDLERALKLAGETFDRKILETPPINETSSLRIKAAAVASLKTLEKVMFSEREFNHKFGYDKIPESLIGESDRSNLWTLLPVKQDTDLSNANQAIQYEISRIKYDYFLQNGVITPKKSFYRREQLEITEALHTLSLTNKRVAVIGNGDPYFAYLVKTKGASEVDFITPHVDLIPQLVMDVIDAEINVVSFADFMMRSDRAKYDFILISGIPDLTPLFEIDLAMITLLLKPNGDIIFVINTLIAPESTKVIWPVDGALVSFYSLEYLRNFLNKLGIEKIDLIANFGSSPIPEIRGMANNLADCVQVDPEHLLGRSIILVNKSANSETETQNRLASWLAYTKNTLIGEPLDKQNFDVQADIAILYGRLEREGTRSLQFQNAMIDRENALARARREILEARTDFEQQQVQFRKELIDSRIELDKALIQTRKELIETRIDLDSVREQLRQANKAVVDAQTAADSLATLKTFITDLSEAQEQS